MTDPGPALTLGQMLDRAAARSPDRTAVAFKGERIGYGELKRRVDDFARGLLGLDLGPGDHVMLWMPNCVEWNVANLAIAKIGAVTVKPLQGVRGGVRAAAVGRAGPDHDGPVRRRRGGLPRDPRRARAAGALPAAAPRRRPGGRSPTGGAGLRGRRAGRPRAITVRPEDPVEMLYTSGTTGEPKGCLLSHGNMYYKCRVYTELHGWTAEDRCLVAVPYFHIFGSMGGIAANCLVGSTQVLMDVYDPLEAMRLIEAERVTIFSGVPTMFITLLGHPAFGTRKLSSLRTGSIGAAPVPMEIMRRILDRERGLGMDALVVYGLTEATGGTHWTRPGDPIERRVSTVGVRTAEIEDRIVDPATGRELPPDEEGELCIKGPTLMIGYYNKPEATAEKIRDGWLHTGDMAVKDREGYVRITGRLTDMIIVGGFNTYPAEIEDFFLRHPKVLDVSIVGVPDAIMGEAVMAFVIPKEGETLLPEEIVAFARGRIANFKVPKYVEIVERFPLTGSGKVQKFKQKAYAVEKYALEGPA
jgi:fatty-acyl-CoA synthase